jgi:hypothetical protein
MFWRRLGILLGTAVLTGTANVGAQGSVTPLSTVLRVNSGTPGHEVRFRGVLLVPGQPMQVVEEITPFELRLPEALVLGAFERDGHGPMLRLEFSSADSEPTVVTAPRVMVGQGVGGVATEFVQGY